MKNQLQQLYSIAQTQGVHVNVVRTRCECTQIGFTANADFRTRA